MNYRQIIISAVILLQAAASHANPTVSGSTGLITVPTADTLFPGSACVGVWGEMASGEDHYAITMPVGITIGLGRSWEVHGSYPNILLNGQESRFDEGIAELGAKIRVKGDGKSRYKLAVDIFGQRTISSTPEKDGISNFGGRIIGSLLTESMGLHLFTGYKFNGGPFDNEVLYGAGAEYSPTARSKVIVELTGTSGSSSSQSMSMEGGAGVQYYLSPHLTLNVAGSVAVTGGGPDWRATVGFSTCQGLGTYIKPIPHVPRPGDKVGEVVVKPIKVFPLTPLLMTAAASAAPVSKLEVQVDPGQEEIYVKPSAQVIIPAPATQASVTPPAQKVPAEKGQKETAAKAAPAAETTVKQARDAAGVIPAEGSEEEVLKDGETPLYGIDVKGDKLSIATDKTPRKGEKMVVYRKYRFPDVVYEYNQTELSADVKKSLSEVADLLRTDKKWSSIRIDAHTDGVGSDSYNMDLSLKRAITIATYLTVHEGMDPSKVFIKGMGKTKLIADNATTTGRKANRRFEILLLSPVDKPATPGDKATLPPEKAPAEKTTAEKSAPLADNPATPAANPAGKDISK